MRSSTIINSTLGRSAALAGTLLRSRVQAMTITVQSFIKETNGRVESERLRSIQYESDTDTVRYFDTVSGCT